MKEIKLRIIPDKLGDAIIYWNAAELYGGLRIHCLNPWGSNAFHTIREYFPEIPMEYVQHYDHDYWVNTIPMMHEWFDDGFKIRQFMPKCKDKHRENYVTVQTSASKENRKPTLDIKDYWDGDVVDLNDGRAVGIPGIIKAQHRAKFHIGADSGCAWTALSVGTPVKVKYADNHPAGHRELTERIFKQYDVEILND